MATPCIGSEGWACATNFYEESETADLVRSSVENSDLNKLVTLCSSLRQGIGCKVSEKFTSGTRNLVRLVQFDDGVKWAARIWMFRLGQDTDEWALASAEKVMESQVATYKYLKQHTTIPVPEVYGYNARVNEELGAPYMLLTYIHGTIADDMEGIDSGENEEGTRHVLEQLANMMVEMASCKFDRIGSIFANEDGDFEIGPLVETDGGPYETAQEYYQAISMRRFHVYADRYFASNKEARRDPGLFLPFIFNNLIRMFTNSAEDRGPFGLTNMDFGPHNVLVDEKLNIVGLIDCDGIVAAPIHVVAQVPIAGCLGVAIPGYKPTNPVRIETHETDALWLDRFVPMVADAEKKVGKETPIADAMISDAAKLVYGLNDYQGLRDWLNVTWLCGYSYLYYQRIGGFSAAIEFTDADLQKDFGGGDGEETEKDQEEQKDRDKGEKVHSKEEADDDDDETEAPCKVVGGACEKSCGFRGLDEDVEDGSESEKDIKQRGTKASFEGKGASEEEPELVFLEDIQKEVIVESKDTFGKELIAELKEGLMIEFRKELRKELPKELAKEVIKGLAKELEQEDKEGRVIDFKKTCKNEIGNELGKDLESELKNEHEREVKKELIESLRKEFKEELKRDILLELRAEFSGTLEVGHGKDGLEIKGIGAVAAREAHQGVARDNLADEQKSGVKDVGHGIPEEEMNPAGVAKEELVLGTPEEKGVDRKGVVDDEEQRESGGIAESCSIMRT